jgi:probable phosphoglycerate mutase
MIMPNLPLTTLLAIRHGETVWNVEERFQGHEDSPLTVNGRRQVDALGRRLQGMAIDTMISSDLGRARESAAIIADYTGHTVAVDHRLRERHYGVLEGLSLPEIKAAHAEVLAQFNADDPDYVIPGGESHRMHYERNIAWLEEVMPARPGHRRHRGPRRRAGQSLSLCLPTASRPAPLLRDDQCQPERLRPRQFLRHPPLGHSDLG